MQATYISFTKHYHYIFVWDETAPVVQHIKGMELELHNSISVVLGMQ